VARIDRLPVSAADDVEIVAALTTLVNEAYEQAERGLWRRPGVGRTTLEETASAISLGELAVVYSDGELAGTVRTRLLDVETGWFGALAISAGFAGRGLGLQFVSFVESSARDAGARVMQLEVLAPHIAHPHIDWLTRWYQSLGYIDVGRRALAEVEPSAVPFLVAPCDVTVMRKPLASTPRSRIS
jgi:GNAT superfamily N-acetyltransferase